MPTPEEAETRPTLLEHLSSEDDEFIVRESPITPPVYDVDDPRPTYREHLLEEKPHWLRVRLARITPKQWLTAAAIFLSAPLMSGLWNLWLFYKEGEAAHSTQLEWLKDEHAADLKAREERLRLIHNRDVTRSHERAFLEQQKETKQVKLHWKQWKTSFLGGVQTSVCYHSDTFKPGRYTRNSYKITCLIGPKGEIPQIQVTCNVDSCRLEKTKIHDPTSIPGDAQVDLKD